MWKLGTIIKLGVALFLCEYLRLLMPACNKRCAMSKTYFIPHNSMKDMYCVGCGFVRSRLALKKKKLLPLLAGRTNLSTNEFDIFITFLLNTDTVSMRFVRFHWHYCYNMYTYREWERDRKNGAPLASFLFKINSQFNATLGGFFFAFCLWWYSLWYWRIYSSSFSSSFSSFVRFGHKILSSKLIKTKKK